MTRRYTGATLRKNLFSGSSGGSTIDFMPRTVSLPQDRPAGRRVLRDWCLESGPPCGLLNCDHRVHQSDLLVSLNVLALRFRGLLRGSDDPSRDDSRPGVRQKLRRSIDVDTGHAEGFSGTTAAKRGDSSIALEQRTILLRCNTFLYSTVSNSHVGKLASLNVIHRTGPA